MIGRTAQNALGLIRDLYAYPCFDCKHSEPRFCLWKGRKCGHPGVSYRGVYSNYDAAARALPKNRPQGFDSNSVTDYFVQHLSAFNSGDYPILLRLAQVLRPGTTVFDLGGGFGQCYYAYRKHVEFPQQLRWLVCDRNAFTQLGRRLAGERKAHSLSFTENWQHAEGASVYLTNGTLQYIEPDLSEILNQLAAKPPHLLVNRVPACDGATFYTVQRGAGSYSPYKVMNTARFIQGLEEIGYKLVDRWTLPRTLRIPLRRANQTAVYQGFYFALRDVDPLLCHGRGLAATDADGLSILSAR